MRHREGGTTEAIYFSGKIECLLQRSMSRKRTRNEREEEKSINDEFILYAIE